ncbi:MAG: YhdP family protein [Pseudomonadota bacterium]|nr:YhdP family protein [Pseudomonadota bacterium]
MASTRPKRWFRLYPSLWWLTAALLLLLAAYVVIGRQLMLLVPDYRERLETLFEERIQTPLTIAELDGKMSGLVPQFVARQIRLPAPEGDSALELDEVVLGVDVFRSLWHRDLVLKELRIHGVELNLVRGEDGSIRLRGLDALGSSDPEQRPPLERILTLFYRQQLLVISDARLTLEWRGMPPLAASELEATLINRGDEHRLAVNLEARDRPLSLQARVHLHGDAFTLEEVEADLYANLKGERLHEWLPRDLDWPVRITDLDGRLKLWTTLQQGQPHDARVLLNLPALTLRQNDRDWPMTALSAQLALQRDASQATVSLTGLSGESPAGPMNLGDMALRWDTGGDQRQWQFRGSELPLHAVSQQFQQWPFPVPDALQKLRERLHRQVPRGLLDGVYVRGRARQLELFQLRFTGLSSQAEDRIPGVQGLSGWVSGGPDRGQAHLYSENLSLQFPRLYDHALTGQMSGVLDWQRDGEHLQVRSGRLRVVNPDAHGEAMMQLRLRPEQVPELRLAAEIYEGNGARASHYMPLKRLPDGVSNWLAQAIQGGYLQRGQILYQGPVKIDKSRQQDRTLQMRYQGQDVRLSFLPDWPMASGVSADVLINGRQVRGLAHSGRLLGSELRDVHVDVAAYETGETPRLVISGEADGPLKDLDTLFQDTPLRKQLPGELLDWRFRDGSMAGYLLLDLPLGKDGGAPMVIVDANIDKASLHNQPRNLRISDATAPVYFHLRNGVQIDQLHAKALDGEFSGQWLTRDGRSRLQLDGHLPMKAAARWLGFAWLAPLKGELPLGLTVQVPWQGTDFSLRAASSMKGVTVDVPAPLGKKAQQTRPLDIRLRSPGNRLALDLDYGGGLLRGVFQIDKSMRGDLLLGAGSLALPADGIQVRGRLAQASVEPWIDFIGNQLVPSLESETRGVAGESTSLSKVSLQVDRLDLFGVEVPNTRLSVLPARAGWDLALSSRSVAGTAHIPDGFSARGDKPIGLSMSRLHLDLPEGFADDDGTSAPVSPLALPPVDAELSSIVINGENFGQWRGEIRPVKQGVRITGLDGRWRSSRYQGTLDWTEEGGEPYSRFNGSLSSDNLGRSLQAWDMPALIESDDARAQVVLGWADWPLGMDYLALDGQARVDIGECRIPDTDTKTSFLRLLGILNIGTIQRRLRLDFSDLYKKGLSCDSITGDFSIDGARVATANLAIDSPSAAIRVKGAIDLEKETLDHNMEVTLPLSSNLYAGCLAGPAACAGIFVVERIWGDRLDKTTTMEYRVTGNWSNPQVKETEGMFE